MSEFKNIIKSIDFKALRKELHENSFFIFKKKQSIQYCQEVIKNIDLLSIEKNIEINYRGSEHRVWHAEKKSKPIKLFKNFSDDLMTRLFNKVNESVNVLAIRNKRIPNYSKEDNDCRWHMDSLFNQYKVFLFLSDVDEHSGPLQIIKGTHRLTFKIKKIMSGQIIALKDIFSKDGSRSYGSIKDDWINRLIGKENSIKNLNVEKGTIVIVNTSMIHRAKPCIKNIRYALTSYYD